MTGPPPGARRSWWRRFLSWGVLAATGVFIVRYVVTHRADFDVLGDLTVAALVAMVAASMLYLVPQAYRYQIVLERQSGRAIGYWLWFRLFVVGQFLNMFLSQAGNVYRSLRLKRLTGVTITAYVGGYMAFTWLAITSNLVAAIAVVGIVDVGLTVADVPVVPVVTAVAALVAAAPFVAAWSLGRLRLERGGIERTRKRVHDVVRASVAIPSSPGFMWRFLGSSLATYVATLAVVAVAFAGLGTRVSAAEVAVFTALLQVGNVINVTPGNLGLQEVGFGALAEGIGVGAATGLLASGLLRITSFIALAITAAVARLADTRTEAHAGTD